jgi:hypothetical protein
LKPFDESAPKMSVLKGDPFPISIGQQRCPAAGGIDDRESAHRLGRRRLQRGPETEGDQVLNAWRVYQLAGELPARVHAGIHDEDAKPERAQRSGSRASSGSCAHDE